MHFGAILGTIFSCSTSLKAQTTGLETAAGKILVFVTTASATCVVQGITVRLHWFQQRSSKSQTRNCFDCLAFVTQEGQLCAGLKPQKPYSASATVELLCIYTYLTIFTSNSLSWVDFVTCRLAVDCF